jgi:hypothetical protein
MRIRGRALDRRGNHVKNTVQVLIEICVGKPQEPNSERLDPRLPLSVVTFRLVREMGITIQFDGQSELGTEEVDAIGPNAVLPAEFHSEKLLAPQLGPEKKLRGRHIFPQAAP